MMTLLKTIPLALSLLLILPGGIFAQDPYKYLDEIRNELDRITDYQADMEVEVDVDFIRMPVKNARVYFKQPDKIRYKSDEFIMLPRMGPDFSINKLMNAPYTAIFNGFDQDSAHSMIVQVLPQVKHPDLILATLWIDTLSVQIVRMEMFTRKQGNFMVDLTYGNERLLPQQLVITFEIDQMNVPLNLMGDMIEIDKEMMKKSESTIGKVYIRFSNYLVNRGINDSYFSEEDPE